MNLLEISYYENGVSDRRAHTTVYQDEILRNEYQVGISVPELMPEYSLGCLTKRDALVIAFSAEEVEGQISRFLDKSKSDEEVAAEFGVKLADKDMWNTSVARQSVDRDEIASYIRKEAFRPFDDRYIFYHRKFVARLNRRVMRHLEHENIALILVRQLASLPFCHAWVTDNLTDQHIISVRTKEGGVVFPLLLQPPQEELMLSTEPHPNLAPKLSASLMTMAENSGLAGTNENGCARVILGYIYAQLHSPSYRERYAEFLKGEFPRVFVTRNTDLFRSLALFGEELIGWHLLKTTAPDSLVATPIGVGEFTVEKASYSDRTVWINEAKTQGFGDVGPDVWEFEVGGYKICQKWLKDRQTKGGKKPRPGRILSVGDINHYRKILAASSETIRIMGEIDESIEHYGGWPGAFQVEDGGPASVDSLGEQDLQKAAEDKAHYDGTAKKTGL